MLTPIGSGAPDVVVVGAGQAGLAASWYLRLFGIDHTVLERGRVGESWRSARWDSFALVTPAWMTRLPGLVQPPGVGEHFTPRDDLIGLFDTYSASLPVTTGVEVSSIEEAPDGFRLQTSAGPLTARAVVAASGAQRRPVIPPMAARLPDSVLQLHAGEYRNPPGLPRGGILVVGSGQSGAQIAEELARAGRQVFLATSRVGRVPRRYRGRDAHEWSHDLGSHDRTTEQASPSERSAKNPLLSGARGGHTLALQQLGRDGVVLLGRLRDINGSLLRFGDELADNLRHGDQTASAFRQTVDNHIAQHQLPAPPADLDPAERANPRLARGPALLNLSTEHITTVIWSVGFAPDTAWIDLPVLDQRGHIQNDGGVTTLPGFYTLGAPWLTHRGSGILYGAGTDAARITRRIAADLRHAPHAERQLAAFDALALAS